ncbi:cytochrome P450 [Rhodococcus opacus]|nr:cytochrome P450 [Rhodococcus opacus]
MRWDPPAWPSRVIARDVDFHGFSFAKNDRVLLAFTAGNNDPKEFDTPDELVLGRSKNRHLTFSAGPHRCIGSHLARLELRIALSEWFDAVPSFTLDPDLPPQLHLGGVYGLHRLNLLVR